MAFVNFGIYYGFYYIFVESPNNKLLNSINIAW